MAHNLLYFCGVQIIMSDKLTKVFDNDTEKCPVFRYPQKPQPKIAKFIL